MKHIIWACILLIIGLTAGATALPMGDENATTENETNLTIVQGNETEGNQTGALPLVTVIQQDPNLTTLSAALDAANLTETLQTGGPYTVFAPNDEAFQALGNETIGQLLNNTDQLEQILLYHVVAGEYSTELLTNMTGQQQNQTEDQNMTGNETGGGIFEFLSGLFGGGQNETQNQTEEANMTGNGTMVQTLLGENITVTQENGQLVLNNDTFVIREINTSTGVIHVIDQVLMPPANMTAGNQTMDNQTMDNQTMNNMTAGQTA